MVGQKHLPKKDELHQVLYIEKVFLLEFPSPENTTCIITKGDITVSDHMNIMIIIFAIKYKRNYLTTKIPKSQDPLSVSYNNDLNVLLRPIPKYFKNPSSLYLTQEKSNNYFAMNNRHSI